MLVQQRQPNSRSDGRDRRSTAQRSSSLCQRNGIGVVDATIETMQAGQWYEQKLKKNLRERDGSEAHRFIGLGYTQKVGSEARSHRRWCSCLSRSLRPSSVRPRVCDGTLHPSPEWSDRTPEKIKRKGPGPDGIGDFLPLQLTGKVNPVIAPKVVSTFTAGFKRTHEPLNGDR